MNYRALLRGFSEWCPKVNRIPTIQLKARINVFYLNCPSSPGLEIDIS